MSDWPPEYVIRSMDHICHAAIQVAPHRPWDPPVVMMVERPGRHHHIIHTMARQGLPTPIGGSEGGYTQGFLTNAGRFVDRAEALQIARACGQVDKIIGGTLTSEDLW